MAHRWRPQDTPVAADQNQEQALPGDTGGRVSESTKQKLTPQSTKQKLTPEYTQIEANA